ncbi:hypothetical protein [Synechococcus sp. C9]|uniref:hypothetical protein n=2 Tax=Synechococcus sp. C9 TaxID=102119 RepID=UPI0030D7DCCF
MGKLLSPKMMPFLLGLLVGLVALWLYRRRQRHSLAYWKKRLSQAQENYHELDQRHEQITQEYQKIQQQLRELAQENQHLHQQLITLQQENAVLIQQQTESTQEQLRELERENQHLHQQLANLQQENTTLLEQQTEPTQTHQEKAQELQQQIAKLQQENQTLTSFCNYFEKCAISTEEKHISLQEQYDSLQQAYLHLQAQLNHSRYNNYTTSAPTPGTNNHHAITFYSNETDFYQDETYELILRLIEEELNRLPNNCYKRRRDLLRSLLECNPSQEYSKQIRTQIKELFSDYKGMTRRLETRLKQLGFSLTEGNHYKITWQDDNRYTFSFAKTPSDYRADNNIARDLIHLLF